MLDGNSTKKCEIDGYAVFIVAFSLFTLSQINIQQAIGQFHQHLLFLMVYLR